MSDEGLAPGKRLSEIRQQQGLSQRRAAELSGLTHSAISTIEQDKVSPAISNVSAGAALRLINTAHHITAFVAATFQTISVRIKMLSVSRTISAAITRCQINSGHIKYHKATSVLLHID